MNTPVKLLYLRSACNAELRTVWPDGSLHWVGIIGRGFYEGGGKAWRMAGVAFDLTTIKEPSAREAA